jgi:hypothetical protein
MCFFFYKFILFDKLPNLTLHLLFLITLNIGSCEILKFSVNQSKPDIVMTR